MRGRGYEIAVVSSSTVQATNTDYEYKLRVPQQRISAKARRGQRQGRATVCYSARYRANGVPPRVRRCGRCGTVVATYSSRWEVVWYIIWHGRRLQHAQAPPAYFLRCDDSAQVEWWANMWPRWSWWLRAQKRSRGAEDSRIRGSGHAEWAAGYYYLQQVRKYCSILVSSGGTKIPYRTVGSIQPDRQQQETTDSSRSSLRHFQPGQRGKVVMRLPVRGLEGDLCICGWREEEAIAGKRRQEEARGGKKQANKCREISCLLYRADREVHVRFA